MGSANFKLITGRPIEDSTKTATKVIDKTLKAKPDISDKELARQTNKSPKTVKKFKGNLGWNTRVKPKALKMIKDQEKRICKGAAKIYKQIVLSKGAKILIMDDETYVPLDPTQVPGKHFYSLKHDVPIDPRFVFDDKSKFDDKFLV